MKDLYIHHLIKLSLFGLFSNKDPGNELYGYWTFLRNFSSSSVSLGSSHHLKPVLAKHGSDPCCVSVSHRCHKGNGGRQKLFSCL